MPQLSPSITSKVVAVVAVARIMSRRPNFSPPVSRSSYSMDRHQQQQQQQQQEKQVDGTKTVPGLQWPFIPDRHLLSSNSRAH